MGIALSFPFSNLVLSDLHPFFFSFLSIFFLVHFFLFRFFLACSLFYIFFTFCRVFFIVFFSPFRCYRLPSLVFPLSLSLIRYRIFCLV